MTHRNFLDTGWIAAPCSGRAELMWLGGLVNPWPASWPGHLHDLNAAAGVEIPPRAENHLHPHVHAQWNGRLFELICASRNP